MMDKNMIIEQQEIVYIDVNSDEVTDLEYPTTERRIFYVDTGGNIELLKSAA